jgi:hypothetical protein
VKCVWWEIFKAEGVYIPGLASGCISRIRHIATAEGSNRHGGKCVRHDFSFNLDMLNRHVDHLQAWEEHGVNIMSKFAIDKEEDEDGSWDGDDNN